MVIFHSYVSLPEGIGLSPFSFLFMVIFVVSLFSDTSVLMLEEVQQHTNIDIFHRFISRTISLYHYYY